MLKGNPKSTAELIPADTVVNTMVAVAWYQAARTSSDSSTRVYNLISNSSRRLTWQSLGKYPHVDLYLTLTCISLTILIIVTQKCGCNCCYM